MSEASTGKHLSFWGHHPAHGLPADAGDISVDVAVLGRGIIGLTATLLLKRMGKTVALIEMHKVAEGPGPHHREDYLPAQAHL